MQSVTTASLKKKFPDEVHTLRALPLPDYVLRELWIRTQNKRAWRRFYILPETTAEIEFNTAEKYQNPHFHEKDWENAPPTGSISLCHSLPKNWLKRGMKSNNSLKGSFWQSDEGHFFRTGNRVPTMENIDYNECFQN